MLMMPFESITAYSLTINTITVLGLPFMESIASSQLVPNVEYVCCISFYLNLVFAGAVACHCHF